MDQIEPFQYVTGETILPGDRVSYAGSVGCVEFVVGLPAPPAWADSIDWYAEDMGPGYMIRVPSMGLVYLHGIDEEDLELIARAEPS